MILTKRINMLGIKKKQNELPDYVKINTWLGMNGFVLKQLL